VPFHSLRVGITPTHRSRRNLANGRVGRSARPDKLQRRAVRIVKIGGLTVEYAARPVLLEGDLDVMSGQMMEGRLVQVVRETAA
jgi:hypothetical protein